MCRSHGRWLELLHARPQNKSATKVSHRAHAGKLLSVDIHKLQPHSRSAAGYEVPCAASRPALSVDIHKLQPHSRSAAGYEVPCAASRPALSVDIHKLQPHSSFVAGYEVPYANRGGRDINRVVVARSRIWAHW